MACALKFRILTNKGADKMETLPDPVGSVRPLVSGVGDVRRES